MRNSSETLEHHDSFEFCMRNLRAGDDQVAQHVWDRFAPKLRERVAIRLMVRARSIVDSDDILQSAFRSFFCGCSGDQFDLENWFALWRLLVTIVDRKCFRQNTRSQTQKRGAHVGICSESTMERYAQPPMAACPVDDAIFAETLEAFFESRDADDRTILWLYLRGLDSAGIAKEVGLSQRTIQRSIRRAASWLRRRMEEPLLATKVSAFE